MLFLTRQRDESLIIGDDIIITVCDIVRDKARLGVTAPRHVPVHRQEVAEKIQREERARDLQRHEGLLPPPIGDPSRS